MYHHFFQLLCYNKYLNRDLVLHCISPFEQYIPTYVCTKLKSIKSDSVLRRFYIFTYIRMYVQYLTG